MPEQPAAAVYTAKLLNINIINTGSLLESQVALKSVDAFVHGTGKL